MPPLLPGIVQGHVQRMDRTDTYWHVIFAKALQIEIFFESVGCWSHTIVISVRATVVKRLVQYQVRCGPGSRKQGHADALPQKKCSRL